MNKLQSNLNQNKYLFFEENAFENVACENSATLYRSRCVKLTSWLQSILYGTNLSRHGAGTGLHIIGGSRDISSGHCRPYGPF